MTDFTLKPKPNQGRPVARKVEEQLEWRKSTWKDLVDGEKARVQHLEDVATKRWRWIEGTITIAKIPGHQGHKKKVTFIGGGDASFILEDLELKQFQVLRKARAAKRSEGAF